MSAGFAFAFAFAVLPSTADEPSIVWKYESATGLSAPLLLNDLVVFGDDKGNVRALGAATGEERWRTNVGGRVYYEPQSDGEYVAVEMERRGIAVLKASTGELLWKNPLAKGANCCYVHKDRKCVYAGGRDGVVYCFDSETGKEKWNCDVLKDAPKVPKTVNGSQARGDDQEARPIGFACDGERLYLSIADQMRVVTLDPETGIERGSFLTGGWIWSPPTLADDVFLTGSDDNHLYCVDVATRQKRWAVDLQTSTTAPPLVVDQDVYVGTKGGDLRCLDMHNGKEKWKFGFKTEAGRTTAVYATPILHGDRVVFASMEGRLFGLNRRTGVQEWEFRPVPELQIEHGLIEREGVAFVTFMPSDANDAGRKHVLAAVKLPSSQR